MKREELIQLEKLLDKLFKFCPPGEIKLLTGLLKYKVSKLREISDNVEKLKR